MKNTGIFSGMRSTGLFWLAISLGSCTLVQNFDSSSRTFYTLGEQTTTPECVEFKRPVRFGHSKPKFPKVDLSKLSQEEVNDVLLTYAERLKNYITNEDKYLSEDILYYNLSCRNISGEFLKKDSGYIMGAGEVSQLSKVP